MADHRYCRLCNGPCDNCGVCRRNSDRFKPSSDMIKTALEKKGAFTSSTFRTISSEPPKISVTDQPDGGSKVAVRLTSMPFLSAYRDPQSPKRRELEKAAREEIIRSFELPRHRVRDGDIEVDIREGSVKILVCMSGSIVSIATATITALNTAPRENVGAIKEMCAAATGAIFGAAVGSAFGPPGMGIGAAIGYVGGSLFGKK